MGGGRGIVTGWIKIKVKVKGVGQECPTHTIKINVNGERAVVSGAPVQSQA
jgi:hypothetical protein